MTSWGFKNNSIHNSTSVISSMLRHFCFIFLGCRRTEGNFPLVLSIGAFVRGGNPKSLETCMVVIEFIWAESVDCSSRSACSSSRGTKIRLTRWNNRKLLFSLACSESSIKSSGEGISGKNKDGLRDSQQSTVLVLLECIKWGGVRGNVSLRRILLLFPLPLCSSSPRLTLLDEPSESELKSGVTGVVMSLMGVMVVGFESERRTLKGNTLLPIFVEITRQSKKPPPERRRPNF